MWKFFNNISINYLKVDTTEGCPIGPGSTLQKEVQLVCIRYHRQCSVTKTPQHILRKHTSSTFWAHEQACPTPTSFYSSILPNTINSSKIVFCATFSPPRWWACTWSQTWAGSHISTSGSPSSRSAHRSSRPRMKSQIQIPLQLSRAKYSPVSCQDRSNEIIFSTSIL